MSSYRVVKERLLVAESTWLVTGVAGFIGSNLLQTLLELGQSVVGLDNFETGHRKNLELVREEIGLDRWAKFKFIEGSILDLETCQQAVDGVDYVLHQAALGSVPRSLKDPIHTNMTNVCGFLNMLVASRDAEIKRFVYAASSSTYGDHIALPKVEDQIGKPLSPYAVTKLVNELYAEVFSRCYEVETIGLRYFNVFGPRQDPNGAYAAVIPRWYQAFLKNEAIRINGDGSTSRDFSFVENVVQANLLAATTTNEKAVNQIYNVAVGERTSLTDLFYMIRDRIVPYLDVSAVEPQLDEFRAGDVLHSQADISKITRLLGYKAEYSILTGLDLSTGYYVGQSKI